MIYTSTKFKPKRKPKKIARHVAAKYVPPAFVERKPPPARPAWWNEADELPPTVNPKVGNGLVKAVHKYDPDSEMALREAAAQVEIARKAKCVAPAYNKGAYMYIATEEQAKYIGR